MITYYTTPFKLHLCFVFSRLLGADRAPDGGWVSAPGFFLVWSESLGGGHTFPPDQVCA